MTEREQNMEINGEDCKCTERSQTVRERVTGEAEWNGRKRERKS